MLLSQFLQVNLSLKVDKDGAVKSDVLYILIVDAQVSRAMSKSSCSNDIIHLLFDFFQLFFHHYNVFLNFSIAGLRSNGVNFPSYFLRYEAKLFSISLWLF